MHKILHFTLYFSLSTIFGCGSTKPIVNQQISFDDDLTPYRLKVEVTIDSVQTPIEKSQEIPLPSNHITDLLNEKLKQNSQWQAQNENFNGFRLLAYSGTNRNKATQTKEKLSAFLEDNSMKDDVTMGYEQPNYKVKVGAYLNKFEAHAALSKLRAEFPLLIIIQENIKSSQIKYGNE
ncbi:MAG: hypothetical protein OHK0038_08320 [Flammeovirgaceae bacterium]